MPAGQGLDIGGVAQTILAAVVAHFDAAAGISLPARRFVAPGSPRMIAWDGEGVAVTHSQITVGSASGQNAGPFRTGSPVSSTGLRNASFAVQIVVCVPESVDGTKPPTVEKLTQSGIQLMRTAGLLSQALVDLATPTRPAIGTGAFTGGGVEVLGPVGGLACVEGSLTCTVGTLV